MTPEAVVWFAFGAAVVGLANVLAWACMDDAEYADYLQWRRGNVQT